MTRANGSPWNVVGVLTPMLAAIALGSWRGGQGWLCAAATLAIAWLCGQALFGVQVSPQLLYLAQHAGINLFLAVVFGSTLRAGHTALITTMAQRVHARLTPAMAVYTRKVTRAWAIYFVAIAAVSLALYAWASFEVWAVFANLLSPLTVVAMFGAEHLLRYQWHPEFERASIVDAVRSYLHGTQAAAAPRDPAA
jgi:uncharacterized membrane protein